MRTARSPLVLLLLSAIIAQGAIPAGAFGTTIQDLVRIKGLERNVLTGMGIVIGLNGTGDKSKNSYVAARPYSELLKNLGNPLANLDELVKADAYAIVEVSMEIPATGAREGDRFDISVSTLFNAKSLAGGRLIVSLLRVPRPDAPVLEPFAFAEGPIVVEGTNLRSGVVRNGGQMMKDIRTNPVSGNGTMTLVLKDQYAGYPVATMISGAINDEFMVAGTLSTSTIAVAEDSKNIRVLVPSADRPMPAQFIANLMTIPIDPSLIQTEARIVINEKQGIILVTGNVQIGPVGITHRGLTITSITPPLTPTPDNPSVMTSRWTGIDTTDRSSRNSTRLVELLEAFKQLNVPVADQIAILHELRKTGALHAEIVTQ